MILGLMITDALLKQLRWQTVLKYLNLFKLNIYFIRAKFFLDFKTNIEAFLCFEIYGKFRSNEIYIIFKKV